MTDVLLYTLGVVIFVLALLISIGLHELGHLVPAKRFGCKITQYFIGFGPTVWSTRKGETEVGIKAIPLGGYVKIVGMLPPGGEHVVQEETTDEAGNTVYKVRRSNTGLFTQLVAEARAAEWELVRPEDTDRLFYRLPWWKKVIVMAGGPMVNIVLAFACFLAVFGLYGVRTTEIPDGPPVVGEVSECIPVWDQPNRACGSEDTPAPAADAGLRAGDTVVALNGAPVTDWDTLQKLIRTNERDTIALTVERDGERVTLGPVPAGKAERPVDPDATSRDVETTEVGFLGMTPQAETVTERGGPLFTLQRMGTMTVESLELLVQLPVRVWGVAEAIVGVDERAIDSPMSIVGGGRIAGETAIEPDLTWADKGALLASLIGGFNLFIGLFNFVPLLPLDGGHIASAVWEGIRRRLARLRGRPDPGYVDAAKLLPVAYVVAACFIVMSLVLIVGDIVAPLSLSG